MKELFMLFAAFFRIGGLTFGGGYAMLPMLQKEVVDKYGWATEEELMDYYAIGQCTPGIIAVNVATFVGFRKKGVLGAAFATFGVIFPSLIIITVVAMFLTNIADIPAVQHALNGIRVIVCVLILQAVIKLWKTGVKGKFGIAMFAAAFLIMVIFGISPVFVVVGAAFAGIISGKIKTKKEGQ